MVINYIRNNRVNLGIILLMIGISLRNLISIILLKDISYLTIIIMFIGVLCIIDYKNIINRKIEVNYLKILILLFVSFFTIQSVFYQSPIGAGTSLIYNVFTILLILVFMTRKTWDTKESFVKQLFYITGFLSLIEYYFIGAYMSTNSTGFILSIIDQNGNIIADRLTLTTIPLLSIVSSICYSSNKKREVVLKYLFIIISVFTILPMNRRGPVIELIVWIFLIIVHNINRILKNNKKNIFKAILSFSALIILFMIFMNNAELNQRISELWLSVQKAISTLIGNSNLGVDASAIERYNARSIILNEYNTYSFWEIIFGKGYMYKYLDFPFFQAFIDLGLIGGVIFTIIIVPITIVQITKRINLSNDRFFIYLASSTLCKCFYSGIPYSWSLYFTILLLMLNLETNEKRRIIDR